MPTLDKKRTYVFFIRDDDRMIPLNPWRMENMFIPIPSVHPFHTPVQRKPMGFLGPGIDPHFIGIIPNGWWCEMYERWMGFINT